MIENSLRNLKKKFKQIDKIIILTIDTHINSKIKSAIDTKTNIKKTPAPITEHDSCPFARQSDVV
jgi:hypothetical protein